jgi:3-hydroxymyristoyl/3-hydroxydecanoyl-(acyl carrier protein) dehydratase
MVTAGLPHAYPFRFADTVLERPDAGFSGGSVRVRVSANGRASMGETWQSPLLLAEAIAQAALLLEGGDSEAARKGFLVGIDDFEAARVPRAGETLEVRVRLTARFGAVVRFDGEVYSDGEAIARGAILVRKGESPAGPAVRDAG